MLSRIPVYHFRALIQDKEITLRVPADRVDVLVNVLMFNGSQRLEIIMEEPNSV